MQCCYVENKFRNKITWISYSCCNPHHKYLLIYNIMIFFSQYNMYEMWSENEIFVLLDMFAMLWEVAVSFIKSVHLYNYNSAPTGQIFINFDIWVFFENLLRRFKFYWNVTRTTGALCEGLCTCMIISYSVPLRMRNVPDRSCREVQNTHFMFSNVFTENHSIKR